ncbi:hypothetical protein ACJX0J_007325, partial [Zea mays]
MSPTTMTGEGGVAMYMVKLCMTSLFVGILVCDYKKNGSTHFQNLESVQNELNMRLFHGFTCLFTIHFGFIFSIMFHSRDILMKIGLQQHWGLDLEGITLLYMYLLMHWDS